MEEDEGLSNRQIAVEPVPPPARAARPRWRAPSSVVPRSYGAAPVTISCSTAPKAKTPERASAVLPRACSGDMYETIVVSSESEVEAAGIDSWSA